MPVLGQFLKRRIFIKEVWRWKKHNPIHSDAMLTHIYPTLRIQDFSFGYEIGSQILTLVTSEGITRSAL
jgi:hypothetical protein